MSNKSSSTGGGISILGAIFIVFLVLKLVGVSAVAEWSWWWVFSPIWLPLAFFFIIYLIIVIVKIIRD
ncbi:hypothetical protein D0T49_00265 [Paludibacter sp. 221]|uniref:hypothetical protein n=1 Tax=Paludibacter sp. 221 TaxID=2302939 RepID=UPI0013D3C8E7|nr:hypothetical protein [Paludibacter sp. 221]NDV45486.1 hypothetical protein [Paludibacter sp. 221]